MSYTQDMLTELKRAYSRGVLKVREGDDWVEYQSMREMRQAISDIEAELRVTNKPSGSRLVSVSKGYY